MRMRRGLPGLLDAAQAAEQRFLQAFLSMDVNFMTETRRKAHSVASPVEDSRAEAPPPYVLKSAASQRQDDLVLSYSERVFNSEQIASDEALNPLPEELKATYMERMRRHEKSSKKFSKQPVQEPMSHLEYWFEKNRASLEAIRRYLEEQFIEVDTVLRRLHKMDQYAQAELVPVRDPKSRQKSVEEIELQYSQDPIKLEVVKLLRSAHPQLLGPREILSQHKLANEITLGSLIGMLKQDDNFSYRNGKIYLQGLHPNHFKRSTSKPLPPPALRHVTDWLSQLHDASIGMDSKELITTWPLVLVYPPPRENHVVELVSWLKDTLLLEHEVINNLLVQHPQLLAKDSHFLGDRISWLKELMGRGQDWNRVFNRKGSFRLLTASDASLENNVRALVSLLNYDTVDIQSLLKKSSDFLVRGSSARRLQGIVEFFTTTFPNHSAGDLIRTCPSLLYRRQDDLAAAWDIINKVADAVPAWREEVKELLESYGDSAAVADLSRILAFSAVPQRQDQLKFIRFCCLDDAQDESLIGIIKITNTVLFDKLFPGYEDAPLHEFSWE